MAVGETHTFLHQTVQMRRLHVIKTERGDRVEALLVGEDEDDVGPAVGHAAWLLVAVHASTLARKNAFFSSTLKQAFWLPCIKRRARSIA